MVYEPDQSSSGCFADRCHPSFHIIYFLAGERLISRHAVFVMLRYAQDNLFI